MTNVNVINCVSHEWNVLAPIILNFRESCLFKGINKNSFRNSYADKIIIIMLNKCRNSQPTNVLKVIFKTFDC